MKPRAWLWLAGCGLAAAAELQVSIRDASDGQPTAAAVRLHDSQGRLHIPDTALDLSAMGYLYAPGALIHYADWTSPRARSQDPFFGSSWFRQQHPAATACFFVEGGFRIQLPAGRFRLIASKGLEYTPVEKVVELGEDRREETLTLSRWVDMAERGWYSGDGHVHIERATAAADPSALLWAAAEDVRISNVLRMGDARGTYYPQYAFGPAGRASAGGRWLAPGQEDPRTRYLGHTLHLNLAAPVRTPATYYAYGEVFERVRRGGGLSGFAHAGRRRWSFQADRGLALLAPAGLVDFVEIAQMGYIGVNLWYEFLNLGFHLTAMAGSDVPWGGTIGTTRVYAYTGAKFDPDRWFEAVRRGRTFVTTGPMLEFTVNGQLPGAVLKLAPGEAVRVGARAWGGRPLKLKLVSFGQVLKEVSGDGALETEFTLRARDSLWITALCETNAQPLMDMPGYFSGAVATPVYVEVDGQRGHDARRLDELVQSRLQSLDDVEKWLRSGGAVEAGASGGWESPQTAAASATAIQAQIEAARAYWRKQK